MSPYPTVISLPLYPHKHLIVQRSMTKNVLKVLFIWDHAIGIFKKFSKTLILSKVQNALTMQTHVFLLQFRDSNGRTLSTEKHEHNVRLRYKVVQIWPGLFVLKQLTFCPVNIWTTLYIQSPGVLILVQHILWNRILESLCYKHTARIKKGSLQ
jgi:hypothetical protein